MPREKLRAFAADQFQVLESDLRSAGQLVARFGGTPSSPFFAVFGENTGRMARALRSRYGFTAEETAFFDFFAELPPDFDEDATAVIVHGLREGADVGAIKRSVRLLQAYEKSFWDAMSR